MNLADERQSSGPAVVIARRSLSFTQSRSKKSLTENGLRMGKIKPLLFLIMKGFSSKFPIPSKTHSDMNTRDLAPLLCRVSCGMAAALVFAAPPSSTAAITYTTFNASQWGTSDATLGITGYTIVDFESTALPSPLQISVSNVNSGAYGPTSNLPFIFNPLTDPNPAQVLVPGIWDGGNVLINHSTSSIPLGYVSPNWGYLTFSFTTPVQSVGFSVQQMDFSNALFVNGTQIADITTVLGGAGGRNGYIRIDANAGDVINSVEIRNAFGDGYAIDRLAFQPVPEPASLTLLSVGLGGLLLRRRRQARTS